MKTTWVNNLRWGTVTDSQMQVGKLTIIVHRHIAYPETTWLLSCFPLFTDKELSSEDLKQAQCQATALVQVELENAVHVIANAKGEQS